MDPLSLLLKSRAASRKEETAKLDVDERGTGQEQNDKDGREQDLEVQIIRDSAARAADFIGQARKSAKNEYEKGKEQLKREYEKKWQLLKRSRKEQEEEIKEALQGSQNERRKILKEMAGINWVQEEKIGKDKAEEQVWKRFVETSREAEKDYKRTRNKELRALSRQRDEHLSKSRQELHLLRDVNFK